MNLAHPVSVPKPKIICLLGSIAVRDAFAQAAYQVEFDGNIPIGPSFPPPGTEISDPVDVETTIRPTTAHRIAIADEVFVLNPDGILGASSHLEIALARQLRKPIRWLVPAGSVLADMATFVGLHRDDGLPLSPRRADLLPLRPDEFVPVPRPGLHVPIYAECRTTPGSFRRWAGSTGRYASDYEVTLYRLRSNHGQRLPVQHKR